VSAGVANYVGPWISERFGQRRLVIVLGATLAAVSLGALAIAGVGSPSTGAWLMLAAAGGGSVAPALLALPAEIVGPSRAGAAVGFLMLVGQLGGFLLPALSGVLTAHGGASRAVLALAVAHLLIVIPAMKLRAGDANDVARAVA
jgi:MFS family permease